MKISIRKIHNAKGEETGSILTTIIGHGTTLPNKLQLEYNLIQHAFNKLYPKEEIKVYREVHDDDVPSIIVMKDIESMPAKETTV